MLLLTLYVLPVQSDSWTNLTTLSISAFAKVKENLPPLTAYGCPLRRLRLTVNVDDQFVPEFEPEFAPFLIGGILNCFPDLEELVFDHMRATLFAYALNEQCLVRYPADSEEGSLLMVRGLGLQMEWAMSIRGSHRLRVLALSSLFVLEPKECGSDYADAGTVISDVDMSEGFGPGLLISEVEAGKCRVQYPRPRACDSQRDPCRHRGRPELPRGLRGRPRRVCRPLLRQAPPLRMSARAPFPVQ